MWNRDSANPIDENMYVYPLYSQRVSLYLKCSSRYGSHPIYLEHRFNEDAIMPRSHGVYLHR